MEEIPWSTLRCQLFSGDRSQVYQSNISPPPVRYTHSISGQESETRWLNTGIAGTCTDTLPLPLTFGRWMKHRDAAEQTHCERNQVRQCCCYPAATQPLLLSSIAENHCHSSGTDRTSDCSGRPTSMLQHGHRVVTIQTHAYDWPYVQEVLSPWWLHGRNCWLTRLVTSVNSEILSKY